MGLKASKACAERRRGVWKIQRPTRAKGMGLPAQTELWEAMARERDITKYRKLKEEGTAEARADYLRALRS